MCHPYLMSTISTGAAIKQIRERKGMLPAQTLLTGEALAEGLNTLDYGLLQLQGDLLPNAKPIVEKTKTTDLEAALLREEALMPFGYRRVKRKLYRDER